jgi:hypothetical protein
VFANVDDLKERRPCWTSCGIVEVTVTEARWVDPQDIGKNAVSVRVVNGEVVADKGKERGE